MLLRQMATNAIVRHARWALQCQPARGQHAASALEQFHGEELYDPAYSEPPKGTQSHRTDTFVKEVQILLKHQDIVYSFMLLASWLCASHVLNAEITSCRPAHP